MRNRTASEKRVCQTENSAEGKRDAVAARIGKRKRNLRRPYPHQAVSAPRPGDGLVVSLDKTHLISSRSGSGCSVIGGRTKKKVIPHQELMRVGVLRAFRHTRTYIIVLTF